MSKQEFTDSPPPYTPTGEPSSSPSFPPPSSSTSTPLDPAFFSQPLLQHLVSLPSRIRAVSARNAHKQTADDLATMHILVPHVESFLSAAARKAADISVPGTKPLVGSLVLVPAAAVPPKAVLGDVKERRREGEFVRVARVEAGSPLGGEKGGPATGDRKIAPTAKESGITSSISSSSSGPQPYRPENATEAAGELRAWDPERDERFDSWGRFGDDAQSSHGSNDDGRDEDGRSGSGGGSSRREKDEGRNSVWWWNDESQARRLASYLQPAAIPAQNLGRKTVQRAVADNKKQEKESGKRGWFGGFGKGKKGDEQLSKRKKAEDVVAAEEAPGIKEEKVSMVVSAQELGFQSENEFGVYESVGGWGVVMDVRIKRA
ncbi:hypothetical protein MKZ38_008905 [Zalerion maritima]|uniref:Uncharacterized protein n=1 Tax=Zalerion maritima TaxID=339359 RepID=A0AAD5RGN4_9PEZI|nr:hypothetical protein MKZ38_008905 [Zalerion maritima]